MAEIADFVKTPSEELLDSCIKEQLLTAEHYEVEISDRRLQDTVKSNLKANFSEMGELSAGQEQPCCPTNFADLSFVTISN